MPIGQENCLVANIFTPFDNNIKKQSLPVMIFIHGGGYYWGSNSNLIYNPKHLVQKGVIVVTINYRLGAFGFLCLNTYTAPGNVGLKDQIMAIKWVKSNIEAFGGNPNDLTVFGESAGSASIHYLIVSGAYNGLFNKAILESSSILSPILFNGDPTASAYIVASRLGLQSNSIDDVVAVFENASANDIVKASHMDAKNNALSPYLFGPCVENKDFNNSLITENPLDLLKSSTYKEDLTIILGYNNKEGMMYAGKYDKEGLSKLNETFFQVLPRNIKFKNIKERNILADYVKKYYFENNGFININYSKLIDYFSDSLMIYSSVKSAYNFILNNVTLYNYYFKYSSSRNLNKFASGFPLEKGANHADELFYLFEPAPYKILPSTPSDLKMIDTLTSLWTNFAKHG